MYFQRFFIYFAQYISVLELLLRTNKWEKKSLIILRYHLIIACEIVVGYGGGFMERDEIVEYKERNDSDEEYDEVSL